MNLKRRATGGTGYRRDIGEAHIAHPHVGPGIAVETSRCKLVVSITLTGNSATLIAGALASVVDWVDSTVIIDTGVTDQTLAVARETAGEKFVAYAFPWQDDFAAARNFGLQILEEQNARWGLMLDTDERIDTHSVDMRAVLGQARADVLKVMHDSGAYAKERFFRTPVRGRYVGPTHECFLADTACATLSTVRFSEVPKSPEQYLRKFARDVAVLRPYTEQHPDDPRWFYYLGDALQNLRRYRAAITAYERCASLGGWDEEAAWACYRAAECWIALGDHANAVASCAAGLARHAGIAELSWLAAYASWRAGRYAQATAWAHLSATMGRFHGKGRSIPRLGFQNLHALYEGPYDVLRFALRAMGDETGADEAEWLYHEACAARIQDQNG